jgi:hypothetical protein
MKQNEINPFEIAMMATDKVAYNDLIYYYASVWNKIEVNIVDEYGNRADPRIGTPLYEEIQDKVPTLVKPKITRKEVEIANVLLEKLKRKHFGEPGM